MTKRAVKNGFAPEISEVLNIGEFILNSESGLSM
jgi:hypothetical protein